MIVSYDPMADALYIGLSDSTVSHSHDLNGDLVETDQNDQLVTLLLRNARDRVDLEKLSIKGIGSGSVWVES